MVPDNPTTATHRQHKGDAARVVNARYQQLADHYGTGIVPARVRKPRDKAAVESAVQVINKRVIGYLTEEVFTTVTELNGAIETRLEEINHHIRRADGTTRAERFETEEAPLLQPLPAEGFDTVEWKQFKVGRNYHISCDFQHYSVPYTYAGQLLRVRLSTAAVTIFDGDQLICEHRRKYGRKGQYSTVVTHGPERHQMIDGLWSKQWFLDRARGFGPATVEVIGAIIERHKIQAQGYLDCQNILETLGKRNKKRLEAACQILLNQQGLGSYSTLKRIMATINSEADQQKPSTPAARTRKPITGPQPAGGGVQVRAADHYTRSAQEVGA